MNPRRTDAEVIAIRQAWRDGLSCAAIAARFGMPSEFTAWRIAYGYSFKRVPGAVTMAERKARYGADVVVRRSPLTGDWPIHSAKGPR